MKKAKFTSTTFKGLLEEIRAAYEKVQFLQFSTDIAGRLCAVSDIQRNFRNLKNSKRFSDAVINQISTTCYDFLLDNSDLFLKDWSKERILEILLKDLAQPYRCSQGDLAICGPLAALITMMVQSPVEYLQRFLEFVKTGKFYSHDRESFIEYPSQQVMSNPGHFLNLNKAMIFAYKNTHNWLPYYPEFNYYYQYLINSTRPCELVNIMEFLGYTDIVESIRYPSGKPGVELGLLSRSLIGGLYSNKHQSSPTKEALFKNLLNDFQAGKSIIIMEDVPAEEDAMLGITHVFGVPVTHYMFVKNIEERNGFVHVKYYNSHYPNLSKRFSKDDFMKLFAGYVSASSPTVSQKLSDAEDNRVDEEYLGIFDMLKVFIPEHAQAKAGCDKPEDKQIISASHSKPKCG